MKFDQPFSAGYAGAYDLLYSDKDYERECALLEDVFQRFSVVPVRAVLDMGCGTGNHAIPLARRGHTVVAVDRSPEMLDAAARKAARLDRAGVPGEGSLSFKLADLRNLHLTRSFDAALLMFAVLGYQSENAEVIDVLRAARKHLSVGGMLVGDIWHGPAVLHLRPGDRVKVVDTEDGKLIRAASGEIDVRRHLCRVSYCLWRLGGDRLVSEVREEHLMRFFFPLELELLLAVGGFRLLSLTSFPEIERALDETAWNALFVARAE